MTDEWTEAEDVIPPLLESTCSGAWLDQWTAADDAIEEIREIRRQIFARFDNDFRKMNAYFIELDKQLPPHRIAPPRPRTDGKSAA